MSMLLLSLDPGVGPPFPIFNGAFFGAFGVVVLTSGVSSTAFSFQGVRNMAYTLPTFNITCDICTWVAPPGPLVIRATVACNLQFSRRVSLPFQYSVDVGDPAGQMWLLLPKLTDIRSVLTFPIGGGSKCDLVVAPSGSGRIYLVVTVDDVGKGFGNEFRCASLNATNLYGSWPTPIP